MDDKSKLIEMQLAWHPDGGLDWAKGSFDMDNDISPEGMIKSATFMNEFVSLCERHGMVPEIYSDWMGFDLHISKPGYSAYPEHLQVFRQARDHMNAVLARFGCAAQIDRDADLDLPEDAGDWAPRV